MTEQFVLETFTNNRESWTGVQYVPPPKSTYKSTEIIRRDTSRIVPIVGYNPGGGDPYYNAQPQGANNNETPCYCGKLSEICSVS